MKRFAVLGGGALWVLAAGLAFPAPALAAAPVSESLDDMVIEIEPPSATGSKVVLPKAPAKIKALAKNKAKAKKNAAKAAAIQEPLPRPQPRPKAEPVAQKPPSPAATERARIQQQEISAAAEIPPQIDVPGVLTRKGTLVVEPSIEYAHTDVNQFSFGGVAILDTVLVGAIEANQNDRDAVTATLGLRYGFTNRLEGELRIPAMYRSDTANTTYVNSGNTTQSSSLDGFGLGDIEAAVHYQVNDGLGRWPVFVANFRAKSDTGTGPYDVDRNSLGLEDELATGSGFWGFEPSITVIAPSDPAVFYANVGYLWNVSKNMNKRIGSRTVTEVDPGDAVRVSLGMGLALNEKISFSVGYQHDFIMKTKATFADGEVESDALSVGTLNLGVNWQMSDSTSLNVSVGIGVTNDAPDVRLMARIPVAIDLFK